MYRCHAPLAALSRVFTYAEVCPARGGAVLRFYIRRERALGQHGALEVRREELVGEEWLRGEFGLGVPWSFCTLVARGARFGGGRDG